MGVGTRDGVVLESLASSADTYKFQQGGMLASC